MNKITGLELPESRKNALETCISQIRLARKSLLVAAMHSNIEDRVHDMLTDCIHHLQPILDTCVVVRVRSDKKENEVDNLDENEA